MSDFKSKLPDLKELSSMTSKLFNGLRNSLEEIVKDYKDKRSGLDNNKTEHRSAHKTTKKAATEDHQTEKKPTKRTTSRKKADTEKHSDH